jgi:hypothetical protein
MPGVLHAGHRNSSMHGMSVREHRRATSGSSADAKKG